MCTIFNPRLDQSRIVERRRRNKSVNRPAAIGWSLMASQPNCAPASGCIDFGYYGNDQPPAGWGSPVWPGDRGPARDSPLPPTGYRNWPVQCVSFMDLSEYSPLGLIGADQKFSARAPTPRLRAGSGLKAWDSAFPDSFLDGQGRPCKGPSADPYFIQDSDMSETH